MLVVFCLLFYFVIVYDLCCFYSMCLMCYCGSVSDHLGPSALINLIWFDLITLFSLVQFTVTDINRLAVVDCKITFVNDGVRKFIS